MIRTFKRHLNSSDRRAKDIIAACVETGAGIEYLPEAPRFRYLPPERAINSFEGRDSGPPSGRGTVACGKPWRGIKNFTPTKLDANPMYRFPMRGDSNVLTEARRAWAEGNPKPLRQLLAARAAGELKTRDFEPPPVSLGELFETAA